MDRRTHRDDWADDELRRKSQKLVEVHHPPTHPRGTIETVRRKLVTLLVWTSALMCVTVGGFWIRSYVEADSWLYVPKASQPHPVCRSEHGRVTLGVVWTDPKDRRSEDLLQMFLDPGLHWKSWKASTDVPRMFWQQYGYHHDDDQALNLVGTHFWCLTLPHWLLLVVLGVLPVIRITRFIRRRRQHREGCCQTCGYDLRATPDRCPECGTVVPSSPNSLYPAGRGQG
jgi:hypothetical protein